MQVRLRPRPRVRRGLRRAAQLQEDEEAREGVHHDEGQGEGGRDRAQGEILELIAFFQLLCTYKVVRMSILLSHSRHRKRNRKLNGRVASYLIA